MKLETKYKIILLVACIILFFAHLDLLPINILEARNFVTAREMLLEDNWLLPTFNGEPRYQKPPLPTWLTAISAGIFGLDSLFALRLPAAFFAIFGVCYFFKLIKEITKNSEFAFTSSLILITSFFFAFSGRNGQWDIFTQAFMIAAIYYIYQFFSTSGKNHQNAILAAVFIGLSFMSKGPVSHYGLLLPFIISYSIVYKYKQFQKKRIALLILIILSIIASGWWYWHIYTVDSVNLLRITGKETTNWTKYNVKSIYYYWSFFTQSGVWTIPAFISLLYPYLIKRVENKKAYLFSFLWTISAVILLSIIPEKKQRFLLPVIIPLAINIGFYISYLFRSFSEMNKTIEKTPVYIHFGLIGIIGIIFPFTAGYILWSQLTGLWFWFILLSITLFCTGILIWYNLILKRIKRVFYTTIIFVLSIVSFGFPLHTVLKTNTTELQISELRTWEIKKNINVYEYSAFSPEFIWHYGQPMVKWGEQKNKLVKNEIGFLVNEKKLEEFKKEFRANKIEKVGEYDLNLMSKPHKTHKSRLQRYLYVVTFR